MEFLRSSLTLRTLSKRFIACLVACEIKWSKKLCPLEAAAPTGSEGVSAELGVLALYMHTEKDEES